MASTREPITNVVHSFDALEDYQLGPALLCPAGYPIDLWAPPPSPQGSLTGKFPPERENLRIDVVPTCPSPENALESRVQTAKANQRDTTRRVGRRGGGDSGSTADDEEYDSHLLKGLVLPHDIARAVRWTLHAPPRRSSSADEKEGDDDRRATRRASRLRLLLETLQTLDLPDTLNTLGAQDTPSPRPPLSDEHPAEANRPSRRTARRLLLLLEILQSIDLPQTTDELDAINPRQFRDNLAAQVLTLERRLARVRNSSGASPKTKDSTSTASPTHSASAPAPVPPPQGLCHRSSMPLMQPRRIVRRRSTITLSPTSTLHRVWQSAHLPSASSEPTVWSPEPCLPTAEVYERILICQDRINEHLWTMQACAVAHPSLLTPPALRRRHSFASAWSTRRIEHFRQLQDHYRPFLVEVPRVVEWTWER